MTERVADKRGVMLSGATPEAAAAADRFVAALLGNGADAAAVTAAADEHPHCALLQAYAASLYVFAQSPRGAQPGRRWLARACAAANATTECECAFIAAVEAGLEGDLATAIAGHEAIAKRWPEETVSAKLAEFHLFETGEAARQLQIMQAFAAANPADANVQAMCALAHELNAEAEEAERLARHALALAPDTPWAEHCLGHVYGRTNNLEQGVADFAAWAPRWENKSQYIRSHNSFHLAAFHVARRDFAPASELLHQKIWGFTTEAVVEHTDAILLLWYLELAGAGNAAPWREIARCVEANSREHVFPFLNVIYLFALLRAGATAQAVQALADFERHAEACEGRAREVWHTVGLGLARAVFAYADARWDEAAAAFAPVVARSGQGGGSDEQRGVFDQSYLLALIRSGERDAAHALLNAHVGPREPTPLERYWFDLAA